MIKYLVTLNKVASSLNTDISHLTVIYDAEVKRLIKHHGKKFAVARLKEYLTIGERYSLHQTVDGLPFTKSDRNGFPSRLAPFKRILRSKDYGPIMGLSILRYVEALRLDISKDISSVTQPCIPCKIESKDITDYIEKWGQDLAIKSLPSMLYHTTVKNGPNGSALATSDSDLGAVMDDSKLWKTLISLSVVCKDKLPPDDSLKRSEYKCHSRISQFPEKSGKTRTIAVIDYWSQRALKPLHKSLMNTLRRLKSDGTFSHDNVGQFAMQKTKEKSFIYCADLTAATDRLPRYLSYHLLKGLLTRLSSDLCDLYWTILTDRTFKLTWSNEQVKYECGQPMGAYASWPLFALTHHAIVQYCGRHLEKDVIQHYRIIGDDVIITNEKMALNYKHLMLSLGMTINEGKTVTSLAGAKYSSAEVAKQLFLNGNVVTPLTPGILSNLGNPMLYNTTLGVLRTRYNIPEHFPVRTLNLLYGDKPKAKDKAWLLSSNPMNGQCNALIHPFWEDYDETAVTELYWLVRFKSLHKKATQVRDLNEKARLEWGHCDQSEGPKVLYNDAQLRASDQLIADYEYCLEELDLQSTFGSPDLLELEYISDPLNPFQDSKSLRSYMQSSLLLETVAGLKSCMDISTFKDYMKTGTLKKWEGAPMRSRMA